VIDGFDTLHTETVDCRAGVLSARDYNRVQPDPEPCLLAADRCGVGREACVAGHYLLMNLGFKRPAVTEAIRVRSLVRRKTVHRSQRQQERPVRKAAQ
jgi:hypothetical protein